MAITDDRLAEIYEITKAMGSALTPGEVLSATAHATRRFVRFHALAAALLDPGGQRLRLYVAGDTPDAPYRAGASVPLGPHALAHVVRTREPLCVAGLPHDERFGADDPLVQAGAVSCVVLPLLDPDRTLGAIAFTRSEPEPFSVPDVGLLRVIAEQVVTAIGHARLLVTERKRANHLAIINEVAKRALVTLDLQTLLQQTAALIQEHFAYYDVSVFLVDRQTKEVVLHAQAGAYHDDSVVGYRQDLGVGMVGWSAKTGKTLLANDVAQDPHYIMAFEGESVSLSELVVPIRIGGETVGVINIECTEVGAFDETDVTALETLSDQVAQAIENARLYQEMRYLKELDESILASIPSSILVIDRTLAIVSVNQMCCQVLERNREDLVGECFDSFLHFEPLESASLHRAIERVVDHDQRASFAAIRMRLPNGRERIVDVHLSPVARRAQRRALVFINDITDRRRAEEEVLREKQKLDDIVSAMGAGLILLDRDLSIVWSNRTMEKWFGEGHSLVGRKCYQACRGNRELCPACNALRTFNTGDASTSSQVRVAPGRDARHYHNILAPIRDASGEVVQVIRLTFDVTERERNVERLALLRKLSGAMQGTLELDRLLRLVLTCVTAGPGLGFNRAVLLLVNEDKTVLEGRLGVGPASAEEAARIWRELSEQAQTLDDVLALFDEPSVPVDTSMQYLAQQIRIPLSNTDQVPVRALSDKSPIHVTDAHENAGVSPHLRSLLWAEEFVCVPLIARDVALGAIIADNVFTGRSIEPDDIQVLAMFATHAGLAISSASAYKRLEEQLNEIEETQDRLVRSERLATVGRLAAHVAHEIRNPLATIGGFTRSMLRPGTDADKVERNARIILEEVERLEQILANVMNFTKPGNPILRECDIEETVDALCGFHENLLAERGVVLHKSLDPACPPLRYDPDQIRQVLINLCQNALDSMPNGGELTVLTRAQEEHVEIVIADTGVGMADDVIENLFHPFFTTKVGGTGLGLSVSQKIVHDHGGDILVRSKPGGGSSFTVCLPIPHEPTS